MQLERVQEIYDDISLLLQDSCLDGGCDLAGIVALADDAADIGAGASRVQALDELKPWPALQDAVYESRASLFNVLRYVFLRRCQALLRLGKQHDLVACTAQFMEGARGLLLPQARMLCDAARARHAVWLLAACHCVVSLGASTADAAAAADASPPHGIPMGLPTSVQLDGAVRAARAFDDTSPKPISPMVRAEACLLMTARGLLLDVAVRRHVIVRPLSGDVRHDSVLMLHESDDKEGDQLSSEGEHRAALHNMQSFDDLLALVEASPLRVHHAELRSAVEVLFARLTGAGAERLLACGHIRMAAIVAAELAAVEMQQQRRAVTEQSLFALRTSSDVCAHDLWYVPWCATLRVQLRGEALLGLETAVGQTSWRLLVCAASSAHRDGVVEPRQHSQLVAQQHELESRVLPWLTGPAPESNSAPEPGAPAPSSPQLLRPLSPLISTRFLGALEPPQREFAKSELALELVNDLDWDLVIADALLKCCLTKPGEALAPDADAWVDVLLGSSTWRVGEAAPAEPPAAAEPDGADCGTVEQAGTLFEWAARAPFTVHAGGAKTVRFVKPHGAPVGAYRACSLWLRTASGAWLEDRFQGCPSFAIEPITDHDAPRGRLHAAAVQDLFVGHGQVITLRVIGGATGLAAGASLLLSGAPPSPGRGALVFTSQPGGEDFGSALELPILATVQGARVEALPALAAHQLMRVELPISIAAGDQPRADAIECRVEAQLFEWHAEQRDDSPPTAVSAVSIRAVQPFDARILGFSRQLFSGVESATLHMEILNTSDSTLQVDGCEITGDGLSSVPVLDPDGVDALEPGQRMHATFIFSCNGSGERRHRDLSLQVAYTSDSHGDVIGRAAQMSWCDSVGLMGLGGFTVDVRCDTNEPIGVGSTATFVTHIGAQPPVHVQIDLDERYWMLDGPDVQLHGGPATGSVWQCVALVVGQLPVPRFSAWQFGQHDEDAWCLGQSAGGATVTVA